MVLWLPYNSLDKVGKGRCARKQENKMVLKLK